MSTQTADVLDAARDLLDREGWRQGVKTKKPGRCALVAIATADLQNGGPTRFIDAAEALADQVSGQSISAWNDAPGRRVSDVLAALTAAAAHERQGA
jgi:hypothetical protein